MDAPIPAQTIEPEPDLEPSSFPFATWGPWIAVGAAVTALIVGLVISLPVFAIAGGGEYDSLGWGARAAIQLCTAIGFLAVPFVLAKEFPGGIDWRQAAGRLGFHRFEVKTAAKWIGLGFVSYIAFALVFALIFGTPEQDDIAGELGPLWSQILLIVILAPLSEEVCFRGMLFGGFRTRFPLPVAALGAGLVFGLLHYSTGISAVPQLIVLGAIFAVVYEKTGSLWPAVIFHLINNAYALTALNS
ncbi:MAG: CPBP family intramembrane metalloprotease [Solirubrobacterales bacterium]|nr:CPBP family intramembrane metalloprotease [Solirubrobacterales bacterium]